MPARATLRDPQVVAAQVAALRAVMAERAGEFESGALAALCWLLEGGPGPISGEVGGRPGAARAVVQELTAAEAVIYGGTTDRPDFARGVEHALMWARFATCSGPAGTVTAGG